MLRRLFAGLVLLFTALRGPVLAADTVDTQGASGQNPAGPECVLALSSNTFHVGEVMTATLSFTAAGAGYSVDTSTGPNDASDVFTASPSDSVTTVSTGDDFSGGTPSLTPLTTTPTVVTLILNRFLRFDKPGAYQVTVTTSRIVGRDGRAEAVASNAVPVTIVDADAAWAHAQVVAAEAALADPATSTAAAVTLHYLGTPEAADAMLAQLAQGGNSSDPTGALWECRMGLMNYGDPEWLTARMEADMDAPDYVVTPAFLTTLAVVGSASGSYEHILRNEWFRLAKDVGGKSQAAKPVTLLTLLETAWREPSLQIDPSVNRKQHAETGGLCAVFEALPPDSQVAVLDTDWPHSFSVGLPDVLERVWNKVVAEPIDSAGRLPDLLLERIIGCRPDDGRSIVLAEIKLTHRHVDYETLSYLSDITLPVADAPLASQIITGDPDTESCQLIGRYCTAAILPQVKALIARPGVTFTCSGRAAVLTYLLRVAGDFGAKQTQLAFADHSQALCNRTLLSDISRVYYDPNVEQIAIGHISDTDALIAADAVTVIETYGTPAAQALLPGASPSVPTASK